MLLQALNAAINLHIHPNTQQQFLLLPLRLPLPQLVLLLLADNLQHHTLNPKP